MRQLGTRRALTPHALQQRPGLGTQFHLRLLREPGVEPFEESQCPTAVACQRATAHRTTERRLRRWLKPHRPLGKAAGFLHLSNLRLNFRATHQDLQPAPTQQLTLASQPVLELGSLGQREPLEELTRYQL